MSEKKKNGRQNYDWKKMKLDYVTSNLSLKDIAEKYHVRYRTVSDRSSKYGWVAAKKSI